MEQYRFGPITRHSERAQARGNVSRNLGSLSR